MGTREHKKDAPAQICLGIITMSSTRTLSDDESGNWIRGQAENAGHEIVCHKVIDDDADTIAQTVRAVIGEKKPDTLILTGGTGISPRDVTIEAVRPLFSRDLPAFGTLFSVMSYEEITSAAILSRAGAGIIDTTAVFCIPGSLKACKLACSKLIFPELGHLARHIGQKE